MKIGLDCRLWSETTGRYIRNLVVELAQIDKQNEYILFCLSKDLDSIKEQIESINRKGEVERVKRKDFKFQISNFKFVTADIHWHSFAEQLKFPSILNREDLDLVHFPYFSIPLLYRKPYVMTMHDLTVNKMATGRASTLPEPMFHTKHYVYRMVVHEALKKAKKIIVPTKTVKAELIADEHIDPEKIEVTYEGSSLQIRNKSQISKQKELEIRNWKLEIGNYFLYVGNAYPHKNLERLTEAFARIDPNQDNSEIKLVLVGKEDYFYSRLKAELKEKNMDSNIIFTGYVSDKELVNLYTHAKAVVVPSLMEGFGLPAVEAMSLGVPLLVSDIPVLHEVCGDAARYFDPLDTVSIQNALSDVTALSESLLKKMIVHEKKQSEKFSWKKMAEETLDIYENAVQ